MAKVLGVNAVLAAPAAALVIDGEVVAASEEERFASVPDGSGPHRTASWRLPVTAMQWCLDEAGIDAHQLDAVAYSYDPARSLPMETYADHDHRDAGGLTDDRSEFADLADLADLGHLLDHEWCRLRTMYAQRAPSLIRAALPGLEPSRVVHVGHDLSHAASAWGPSGFESCAVMVIDGRGEATSFLAGHMRAGEHEVLASQRLPHSLGVLYEDLAAHLHIGRTCEEHEMSALAVHGRPVHLDRLRQMIRVHRSGGFTAEPIDWNQFAPPGRGDLGADDHVVLADQVDQRAADLARSFQDRLGEVVLDLAAWTHERTGESRLAIAGDVALNRLVTTRLHTDGPFQEVWAQPVSGDAGTALGAAVAISASFGDEIASMTTTALGRSWPDGDIEAAARRAGLRSRRSDDIANDVAASLAADRVVAWVHGRSDFGQRPSGHRSIYFHPGRRLNAVSDNYERPPITAITTEEAAPMMFDAGPLPSPVAAFVHHVSALWADRLPGVIHDDGLARVQTVATEHEALTHRMIKDFERCTGLPVVAHAALSAINHTLSDDLRELLEACRRGSVDVVALDGLILER
jgi:carbamoyltransferase